MGGLSVAGLANLLVVYVIWSSTYLAIRVTVREGSGFAPFYAAGLRLTVAGLLLLAVALVLRQRLRLTSIELRDLALPGLALWVGGNGGVTWAEQHAHSGDAALIIGSMPIWVAAMEAFVDRRAPARRLIAALLVGLAGLGVLIAPVLATGVSADLAATLALIFAAVTWGGGSLYQKRRPVRIGVAAAAGYQNLIGGLVVLLIGLLTGEPWPSPAPDALAAFFYLLFFGSLAAFPAYVQVLRLLPVSIAMTYCYVTPVGAVLLGWWLLGEQITGFTIVGTVLVLAGVAGVFHLQLAGSPVRSAGGAPPRSG
jgi:drug/metabolite transporter (DMT)-like permease